MRIMAIHADDSALMHPAAEEWPIFVVFVPHLTVGEVTLGVIDQRQIEVIVKTGAGFEVARL